MQCVQAWEQMRSEENRSLQGQSIYRRDTPWANEDDKERRRGGEKGWSYQSFADRSNLKLLPPVERDYLSSSFKVRERFVSINRAEGWQFWNPYDATEPIHITEQHCERFECEAGTKHELWTSNKKSSYEHGADRNFEKKAIPELQVLIQTLY